MHRRKYRADPMAMFKTLRRIEPYTESDVVELTLPSRLAFEAIKSGAGIEDHFNELAVCINSTLVRAEGIDPFCVETCKTAQAALQRAKDRYLRTGCFGFDGLALQEIPAVLDLHEEIMRNSNPHLMTKVLLEQYSRIEKQQRGVFA
jgi:hypothetical protein